MAKRWTDRENEILMDYVNHADSVREGLEDAAFQLNRSFAAARMQYYKIIPREERAPATKSSEFKRIFFREIKNNPDNLAQAFRNIAEQTGLTFGYVHHLWYDKDSVFYRANVEPLFICGNKNGALVNSKNTGTPSKKKNLLDIIRKIFKIK